MMTILENKLDPKKKKKKLEHPKLKFNLSKILVH